MKKKQYIIIPAILIIIICISYIVCNERLEQKHREQNKKELRDNTRIHPIG